MGELRGISGRGRIGGVEGVEEGPKADAGGDAVEGGAASKASRTSRPRSVNMSGLSLEAQLDAKLAAKETTAASSAARGLDPSITPAVVEDLQKLLGELGYDCGKADGQYGPKTHAALRKFRAEHWNDSKRPASPLDIDLVRIHYAAKWLTVALEDPENCKGPLAKIDPMSIETDGSYACYQEYYGFRVLACFENGRRVAPGGAAAKALEVILRRNPLIAETHGMRPAVVGVTKDFLERAEQGLLEPAPVPDE